MLIYCHYLRGGTGVQLGCAGQMETNQNNIEHGTM